MFSTTRNISGFALLTLLLLPMNAQAATEWCPKRQHVQVKNWNLFVLGSAPKNRCRLTAGSGAVSVEYILDRDAFEKIKNPKYPKTGSGCVRWNVPNTTAKPELCF